MGIWGVGLYQNDTSLDVKDQFAELYQNGKTIQEITNQLLEEYEYILNDPEESPLFWWALADMQWNYGELHADVKKHALYLIDEADGDQEYQMADRTGKQKREEVLKKLKEKLLSPVPLAKKRTKRRVYQCQWKMGDVFAYQLESDMAKEKGLFGQYLLVQKVDEGTWYPGHIIPIVYVKITKDGKLPSNVAEFEQLEYVQVSFTKYEDRFFPIDISRMQEDLAEKSKRVYEVDEYGYLPEYRARLLNTSKRIIPSKLIYVGNFAGAERPLKEFIPHVNVNIISVSWNEFEVEMLQQYYRHNHRQSKIYVERK